MGYQVERRHAPALRTSFALLLLGSCLCCPLFSVIIPRTFFASQPPTRSRTSKLSPLSAALSLPSHLQVGLLGFYGYGSTVWRTHMTLYRLTVTAYGPAPTATQQATSLGGCYWSCISGSRYRRVVITPDTHARFVSIHESPPSGLFSLYWSRLLHISVPSPISCLPLACGQTYQPPVPQGLTQFSIPGPFLPTTPSMGCYALILTNKLDLLPFLFDFYHQRHNFSRIIHTHSLSTPIGRFICFAHYCHTFWASYHTSGFLGRTTHSSPSVPTPFFWVPLIVQGASMVAWCTYIERYPC